MCATQDGDAKNETEIVEKNCFVRFMRDWVFHSSFCWWNRDRMCYLYNPNRNTLSGLLLRGNELYSRIRHGTKCYFTYCTASWTATSWKNDRDHYTLNERSWDRLSLIWKSAQYIFKLQYSFFHLNNKFKRIFFILEMHFQDWKVENDLQKMKKKA